MQTENRLALAAVVAAGALLRFLPLGYGLPFFYHPDETQLLFNLGRFLEAVSRGAVSIGTSTFHYPLMAMYGMYFAYGRATGRFESLADFKTALVLDHPAFHLLGRLMSVSFSVAALVAVYALGRRLYGHRGGLMAAGLMAVSVIDIAGSHWLKFDSAVSFISLVALLAILRLKDDPLAMRPYLVAGCVVGLALAARIDLLVLVPLLVVAHVAVMRPARPLAAIRAALQPRLLVALGLAAAVYLVVSFQLVNLVLQHVVGAPRLFTTREMGASLLQYFQAGDVTASIQHNLPFYFSTVLLGACGVLLTAAIAAGAGRALVSRGADEIIVLSFLVLTTVPMIVFNVYGTHYSARALPVLMVLAAGLLVWLSDRLAAWRPVPVGWGILLLALVAAQPAYGAIRYVEYVTTNVDTRTRAHEWISREVPAGTRMAVQKFHELPAFLPNLRETPEEIAQKLAIVRADGRSSGLALEAQLANPGRGGYWIVNLSAESYWSGGDALENLYDYDRLIRDGVRYVVTSGFNGLSTVDFDGSPIGILIAPQFLDSAKSAAYERFHVALRERAALVAEFRPRDARLARLTDAPIDPTIRIYRLP